MTIRAHLAFALILGSPLTMRTQADASYTLSYSAEDQRRIAVVAELTLQDSLLYMVPWGGEHLPDGWRELVRNERATDMSGRSVALTRVEGRKWIVAGAKGQRIRLTYDVAVEHDRMSWKPDAREGGYALPSRTFIVGRGLFILPSFELPPTRITVSVPAGWKVSVPWDTTTNSRTFVANTRRELVESVILAGDFSSYAVREGDLSVSYAVGKEFAASDSMLANFTQRLLREHQAVFGGTPAWKRMQVVVNPDPLQHSGGGGVFNRSISMTFVKAPDGAGIPTWGHTLSHELVHLWNAHTLLRASPAEEWMLEGGGDYFGVLALARTGLISSDILYWKMGNAYQRWSRDVGKISLAAAGDKESTPLGGNALYAGGWTTLIALDIDLRSHSGGKVTLDHVMRFIYRRIKSGELKSVANADYLAALRSVSGRDYSSFFARFVTGTERLQLEEYLPRIGLRLNASSSVELDPSASSAAKQLLAAYLAPSK